MQRVDLTPKQMVKDAVELIEQCKKQIKIYEKFIGDNYQGGILWQKAIASERAAIDSLNRRIKEITHV